MGPNIYVPVALTVLVSAAVLVWAKRALRGGPTAVDVDAVMSSSTERLTSNALRKLTSPTWRVVHEIAPNRLGGIAHVLIGPAGIFAVQTRMDPLPANREKAPDAHAVAGAAITRGALDDALGQCKMSSDWLLLVHWGVNNGTDIAVEPMPGVIAVDGRRLDEWTAALRSDVLAPAQVDLAWQTVVTSIGRPDPL